MKPGGSGVAVCDGNNCIALRKIVLGLQQLLLVKLFKIQLILISIKSRASCYQYNDKILSRRLARVKRNEMFCHPPIYTTRPRRTSQHVQESSRAEPHICFDPLRRLTSVDVTILI